MVSDLGFLLTSKLCHQGVVSSWPGAIYMHENIKNMYKIRLQCDFFLNLQQMVKMIKPFCWVKNFDPKALSVPARGYIHVKKKNIKNLYKIRVQRDFFKTCNK